jgi:hypothetical protein
VRLVIEYAGRSGLVKRVDLARAVVDRRTGLGIEPGGSRARVRWFFTGSSALAGDAAGAAEESEVYGADFSGTLVTIYPVTSETVIQSSLDMEAESLLHLEVAPSLPPAGTKARLLIEPLGEGIER